MIRTCQVCESKFNTENRGWCDKHIPHVCSPECFSRFVHSFQSIDTRDFIPFKQSGSFRSHYEKRFAIYVDKLGIHSLYEPYKIEMPNGDFYVPDFFLDGSVFFEVKGIWDGRGKTKFKAFVDNYPELPIFVVDLKMLSTLSGGRK
jgi:hypothetical protein